MYLAVIDLRYEVKYNSLINLLRTIFVCIVLGYAGLVFSRDANNLALRPIERIIEKVNKIASNPIYSKNEEVI